MVTPDPTIDDIVASIHEAAAERIVEKLAQLPERTDANFEAEFAKLSRQMRRAYIRVMAKAVRRRLLASLSKPYPPGTPPRAERRRLQRAAAKRNQPKIKGVYTC
jgi:hypothetical protein